MFEVLVLSLIPNIVNNNECRLSPLRSDVVLFLITGVVLVGITLGSLLSVLSLHDVAVQSLDGQLSSY